MADRVLLRHLDVPDIRKLDVYLEHGGYEAAKKALTSLTPQDVTAQVKDSNLRGRGGAGFVAGMKWGFLPKDSDKPVYLCANADESEPGTFKDRALIEWNTHVLLEGILISAYAINAHTAYIYIRGEFALGAKRLTEAIEAAYARGLLGKNICGSGFDLDVYVHRGAGAYICGEETGLIQSLEGKRAYPRIKPPFPAVYGLFGCPTIVQNVETLACVPSIIGHGPEWFKAIGPETGPGPKIYCVSGHVEKPGLYELPMGMPLREVIYDYARGHSGWKKTESRDAGWLVVSHPYPGRDRRQHGLRLHAGDRRLSGHGRDHRHGRRHLHGPGAQNHQPLLPPRIVRPVFAVPRGHRLACTSCWSVSKRATLSPTIST